MNVTLPVMNELVTMDISDAVARYYEEEKDIKGLRITGAALNGNFSRIGFTKVIFDHCRLTGSDFSNCDFIDVSFESCDLSGCRFREGFFQRVSFHQVKAVGTGFGEAVFKNLTIKESNLSYASFAKSKFERANISAELQDASFAECRLKSFEFENSDLTRADFFKTSLKGLDLRSCRIDGIVLSDSLSELRGAVVDMYQAAALALKLGIEIK